MPEGFSAEKRLNIPSCYQVRDEFSRFTVPWPRVKLRSYDESVGVSFIPFLSLLSKE